MYRHYRVHSEEQLLKTLVARAVSIDQSLARASDICIQITSRTGIRDYLGKYNRREISLDQLSDFTHLKLKDALYPSEDVEGISRFDLKGNLVAQVGLALPREYADVAVDLDQPVTFIGSVLLQGKTYLIVAASIINRETHKVGTDVVMFNAINLKQILQDKSGLGRTGKAFLAMGLDGDVQPLFLAEGPNGNHKEILPDIRISSALRAAIHGKQGLLLPKGESGVVIAHGPVSRAKWGLAISMAAKEVYEPARQVLALFGGLSAIFIMVAVLITIFVFKPLTARLNQEFAARKKSEEKLQFFKTLVDQTQDAIFIVCPDTGRFVEVNEQAGRALGYTREELLAMKVSDIEMSLPDKPGLVSLKEKIRKQGNILFDGKLRCKDGSCIPVEINIRQVVLQDCEYIIASARDVTDKLQARRHTSDLAKIVEDSLNEVYIFDAETFLFLVVNQGARENLGYSMEELQNLTPLDIKPEYTLNSLKALVQPLVAGAIQRLELFTFHKRKDGSFYPVEIHLQVSTYAEKQVFTAIILDITQRKRSEDELQNYQENLAKLVDERTEKLAGKTRELERFNRLLVDRKLRMVELKEEIRDLEDKLNDPQFNGPQLNDPLLNDPLLNDLGQDHD
jgi:PAS domain S-box-containing protein